MWLQLLCQGEGSFPDLCPVSRKPFTADTAVHKAVIQQQHSHTARAQDAADAINGSPLISSQQEATAETNSQSNNRLVMVDFVDQMVDVSVIVSNNGV